MKSMAQVIQADESGALLIPTGAAGLIEPGARFTVEPHGDTVILRRQANSADDWWNSTSPEQRITWLREWMASLPTSPALPRFATDRDSMYD
jgi:hypothetical protein